MKVMSRIFLLLLLINGGLLYVHYSSSTTAEGYDPEALTYEQEIEVEETNDALTVRHHFIGLAPVAYEIVWPEQGKEIACLEEEFCDRVDVKAGTIKEGTNDRQTVTYRLPKKANDESVVRYDHPFAQLKEADPTMTVLHIVDPMKRGGMWVTGLEPIGATSLDTLDYELFAGVGHVPELLWQKEETPLAYDGLRHTLYGERDEPFAQHIEQLLEQFRSNHLTVVLHEGTHNIESERFIALPEDKKEDVTDLLFVKSVQTAYGIPFEERFVAEVVSALLLDEPIGSERSHRAYTNIRETLTEEQYDTLTERLKAGSDEQLSAARFDALVGDVTNASVDYASQTIAGNEPEELLFKEEKVVVANGEEVPTVQPLTIQGKRYYPARMLFNAFGYEVSSNEQSLYLNRSDQDYRFSFIDPFYVHGGHRYDLAKEPYIYTNGHYYFEESAMRRIFKLTIEETEDQLRIDELNVLSSEGEETL